MSWFLNEEDDPIQSRPVDDTLQRTLHLVQEHEKTLRVLERGFGDTTESLTDEYYQPVCIDLAPQERVLPLELINTGKEEKFFKKVLAVFGYLCDEINELKEIAQTTFYPKVILFGYPQSGKDEDSTPLPGQAEEQMGRMLTFMQELSNFVDRCHNSAMNLVQQLAKLYNGKEKLFQSTFQFVHLTPVYDSLADLLGILVTLDCAISQNQFISPAWNDYKRMMQFVRDKPDQYGTTEEKVTKFEKLLVQLDQSVMRGNTFRGCIEMDFEELLPVDDDDEVEEINIRNNSQMLSELFHCLKNKIERSEAIIGTHAETTERTTMVGYVALYVLYRRLTPAFVEPDPKFYRRLWAVQRKVPVVILAGKLIWTLPEFVEEHARLDVKKLEPPEPMLARRQYLETLDANFGQIIKRIHLETISWTVQMENTFQSSARHCGDPIPLLESRGSLLLRGLINANKISTMMKTLVNLHLSLGVPMQRKVLRPLCMCVELLKSLEFVAIRKASVISESMAHISRILSARLLKVTRPIRTKLQASRKFDDHKMDVLAAVNVIETILHGSDSFTFSRQSVLSLSLCVCLNPNIVKESEQEGTMALFKRIQLLADWQPHFKSACNCSFLLWNKELLPTFIADVFKCPTEANRLQYVCAGFCDAATLLRKVQHEEDNVEHLANLKKFILKSIEDGLVKPLCVGVEEDLRLRIHAKTQGTIAQETFNPKKRSPKPLKPFLELKPLRVLGSCLDIRQKVTHYLETMFYNLTTMALYDWMTYADMRNLAAEKFGIEMADNHLPMGSLEYDQGLDVLMIMRNIHIFVGRFSYNLNQQNFVERRPDRGSKNLNTINIQSIAASLRQHGLGILNTTVNFTYQFLAQKFHVFSQFLFDEYIRGHLGKERRWFRKHKGDCNNMYPYDRGLKFVKDIRKLGVLENGRTFLDQFRILITEIGNALGYVRMVRSAGMLFCSEAVRFLPDIDSLINFEMHAGAGSPPKEPPAEGAEEGEEEDDEPPVIGANLSEGTIKAAKNLDVVAGTLASNFSEGSDYFKVLVAVFQQVLLSGDHSHLDNFYMIIPSLCLSWVDASYQAKMYMYKSNRARDTYYTDDGFAVGLAYIMAILKQGHKFDSMHWFQCMREKLDSDAKAIIDKKKQQEAAKKAKKPQPSRSMFSRAKEVVVEVTEEEEEAVHTLQQSENKLQATKRENDLLFFSLSGARVFFKR